MDLKSPLYVYYILCVFCIYNSIYCFSDTCYIVYAISLIFIVLYFEHYFVLCKLCLCKPFLAYFIILIEKSSNLPIYTYQKNEKHSKKGGKNTKTPISKTGRKNGGKIDN